MDLNLPPVTRELLLEGVDFALRTDYCFLHDLECAIARFKDECTLLDPSSDTSDTTLLTWTTSTPLLLPRAPPPNAVSYAHPPAAPGRRVFDYTTLPRTHVSFPFYTTYEDTAYFHITCNGTHTYRGAYSDYADFLILLAHYDPKRDWDAAAGGRWIMSMSSPGRGVFTSPEWFYKAPGMSKFLIMNDQDAYARFLRVVKKKGGAAVLVRHSSVYPPVVVGAPRTRVVFVEVPAPGEKRKNGAEGGGSRVKEWVNASMDGSALELVRRDIERWKAAA